MRCLRHAGIVVRDLGRAADFYQQLLGLRVVTRQDESGPFLDAILGLDGCSVTTVKMAAAEGATLVELLCFDSHEDHRPPAQPFSTGPTHIAFTVDDLMADYQRLNVAGVEFTTPPQRSPDGSALVTFCRDPEGNLIELVEVTS